MPIYEYEHVDTPPDGCTDPFEALQAMSEPPLETCPTCGNPCRRVFSAFGVGGSEKSLLSPSNLEKHGFTQYKRAAPGHYEKTAGAGPRDLIGE